MSDEFKVFAYIADDCVFLSDDKNDHDTIDQIIKNSGRSEKLDIMLTNICPDPFNPPLPHEEDERWNAYMNELLFILEKNGATIIWEDHQ